MTIEPDRTALVLTDLQNDFLAAGGNGRSLFADSYAELDIVGNRQTGACPRMCRSALHSGTLE